MKTNDVIRAWKDPAYRATLTQAQRDALPAHPAGDVEVPDSELQTIAGGMRPETIVTRGCCWATFSYSCF
jgi:mersacidin/lichenicidin family type 2 lantibiotic